METESQNMDIQELFENLKAASKNGKFYPFIGDLVSLSHDMLPVHLQVPACKYIIKSLQSTVGETPDINTVTDTSQWVFQGTSKN